MTAPNILPVCMHFDSDQTRWGESPLCQGRRCFGVTLVSALLAVSLPVQAKRGGDHERALRERDSGRILPLEQVLAGIAQHVGGRMVKVELEDDNGAMRYEIRWLLADGRILEIEIDAVTGAWLELEGARLENVFRGGAR